MIFNDFDLQKEHENPGRGNQSYIQKFLAISGVLHGLNLSSIWESRMEIAVKKSGVFFSPLWNFFVLHIDSKMFDGKKKKVKCCRLFILCSQGFENSIYTELMQLVAWLQEAQPLSG